MPLVLVAPDQQPLVIPSTDLTYRLPSYILDEVFQALILQGLRWGDIVFLRHVLALVCRRWHSHATDNPLLWNDITIQRYTRPKYVKMCLKRSGDADITLRIDCTPAEWVRVDQSIAAVRCRDMGEFVAISLAPLSAHFHKVEGLSMETEIWPDMLLLLASLALFREATRLHWVSARVVVQHRQPVTTIPWLAGAVSPAAMYLTAMPPAWVPPTAFSNLNVLRLVAIGSRLRYTAANLCAALAAAPNLSILQLHSVHCTDIVHGTSVLLPRLEVLEISAHDNACGAVVQCLRMPAIVQASVLVSDTASVYSLVAGNFALFSTAIDLEFVVPHASLWEMRLVLPLLDSVKFLDLRECGYSIESVFSLALADHAILSNAEAIYCSADLDAAVIQALLTVAADGCVIVCSRGAVDAGNVVEWHMEMGLLVSRVL